MPKSNTAFWTKKFSENVERERRAEQELARRGWRVLVVWECELVGRTVETIQKVVLWLRDGIALDGDTVPEELEVDSRKLLADADARVRRRIDTYDHEPGLRLRLEE